MNMDSLAVPYLLLFTYRKFPRILIDCLSTPEFMRALLSLRRADSVSFSEADINGLM